jgi:hypothetical protein
MALREIESTLPPGFRFYPSDEELVCHYLHKKVANERIAQGTLVEVDLHAREPWELPGQSVLLISSIRSVQEFAAAAAYQIPTDLTSSFNWDVV